MISKKNEAGPCRKAGAHFVDERGWSFDLNERTHCRKHGGLQGDRVLHVDEDRREEGVQELPADWVFASLVETAGVAQKIQVRVDVLNAGLKLLVCASEPFLKVLSLQDDRLQSRLQFVDGEVAIGDHFDDSVLLPLEALELSLDVALDDQCRFVVRGQRRSQVAA